MANLFNLTGLKHKPRRNGFDLSRKNIYSISAGELLPVLTEEMIPGDSFTIDLQSFSRSQPMNTAAFARMRQYYDFFFVPYHLLWSRFGNFITNVPNNQISSKSKIGQNRAVTEYAPLFNFEDLVSKIKIYQELQGLINPTPDETNLLDIAGRSYDETIVKLANYLGYPLYFDTNKGIQGKLGSLSIFRFLAYQKIYSDFYRFDQWETTDSALFNVDWYDGSTNTPITMESFCGPLASDAHISFEKGYFANTPFTLRYANYKRDLLRGVLPSAQYGDPSTVKIDANYTTGFVQTFSANLQSANELSGSIQLQDGSGKIFVDGTLESNVNEPNIQFKNVTGIRVNTPTASYLNVLALRFAEAAQKYNEIKGANSYDYIKQIQAHFGVSPDKGLGHCVEYLGGCVSDLSIDPVTNQNLTGNESPQIYGKGTFATSGKINYKCNDYGIVMCITHVLPISDYSSNRISSKLRLNVADDWPIPEFDNLGLQALTVSEIPGSYKLDKNAQLNIFGYAPRYAPWKTALDEVHGDLLNVEKQWTITQDFADNLNTSEQGQGTAQIGWSFFKVVPSVLDSIFAFGSSDNGLRVGVSDQFLCNSYFDFKCVRNLDYDGMPY